MRRIFTSFVLLLSLALPSIAAACGAFVPQDDAVRQSQLRIIYAVDRPANQMTVHIQINYVGEADQFAWILPVPSNPKLEVSKVDFDELQNATEPRLIFPTPPTNCLSATGGAAPGRGPDVLQQGSVGPYDFSVIQDKDPAVMVKWLRDNGYQVSDDVANALKPYAEGGMAFLAMKLQNGREASDIEPVAVTFQGTEPMIPLHLAAVSTEGTIPIYTWIFADQKALPKDSIYFVMRPNDFALTNTFGAHNYQTLRSGVLESVKGDGWVVEYALPTSQLTVNNPVLQELKAKYPYVTRLYSEMSAETMRDLKADPTFKFEASVPDISNVFDLSKRDNPYYCDNNNDLSVRTVKEQQIAANETNQPTSEQVTANLRRGPLRIVTVLFVVAILVLIWRLSRKRPRANV